MTRQRPTAKSDAEGNVPTIRTKKYFTLLVLIGVLGGCGTFSKATYIRYQQKVAHKDCEAGKGVFLEKIQPIVAGTCAAGNCHGKATHALPLFPDKGENNLAGFRSVALDAPEEFYGYISGTSHPGGRQDRNLGKPVFQEWIDAERSCQ